MKGVKKLVKGQEYLIRTSYGDYPNLVFTGFFKENEDVTLACFDDLEQGWESFFDISIRSNEVISQ